MTDRPRLLVLSSVLPFPGSAGQKQRVRLKLRSFRERFHVTFLTPVAVDRIGEVRSRLAEYCDEALLIESRWRRGPLRNVLDPVASRVYAAATGLKPSNYVAEFVDLTPARVLAALGNRRFDAAVVEYWHAASAVRALREQGIPCALDMHNLLWQSRQRQLSASRLPAWLQRIQVSRYRTREEAAWSDYDALISINSREDDYVRDQLPAMRRFYAPMGTDLDAWSYGPTPTSPPRIAYYGGLGSVHNRADARSCYEDILPRIRAVHREAQLWIVGSRPPEDLVQRAQDDPHLVVTGFVEDVQSVLRTMSLVLCPWTGTYGFRSRLVEVLALGVPVVASPDAVDGMDLHHGQGIFLEPDAESMVGRAVELLDDDSLRDEQGRFGREAVEASYSFDATYGRLARELVEWVESGDARSTASLRPVPPSLR